MAAASSGPAIKHGRIQQSIVQWCFQEYWNIDQLCGIAKSLGCKSVELCSPDDWPTLKKHGLTCAIAFNGMPMPPFVKGFNNPKFHAQLVEVTEQSHRRRGRFRLPQCDRV